VATLDWSPVRGGYGGVAVGLFDAEHRLVGKVLGDDPGNVALDQAIEAVLQGGGPRVAGTR
jgi:hypothetical protein